ncbi:MAG: HlyD family secretion protein [Hymenobacteraceae bacterium]|nr:HlyD family secretion protein [Hymenobacteraceae bacterium]
MATQVAAPPASIVDTPDGLVPEAPKKRSPIPLLILATILLVGGFFGWRAWSFAQNHEATDNAQIEGDVFPVLPRISGQVATVLAKENQRVSIGDTLVKLDPRDLQVRVAVARTALAAAQAGVAAARAAVEATQANVSTAQSSVGVSSALRDKLQADLKRNDYLLKQEVITRAEYDAAQANLRSTTAQRTTAENQVSAARAGVTSAQQQVAVAEAVVKQRQADLENAQLQLSYTVLTAPGEGFVSKKNVEPGQVVQPGQNLLAIVSTGQVWVTANFKETQLTEMKVGQPVVVEVDSYPDVLFQGHVESISAATGARFALLPPDNASGNFVKVVQRIPVRIVLDQPDPQHPLRAGMSVKAVVQTK